MLLCFFPMIARAECDQQRLTDLSRIASNVKLSSNYNGEAFIITMSNLTSDLYTVDIYGDSFYGGEDKQFEFYSDSVAFNIYSNDPNCPGLLLTSKTITLPTFNIYSENAECEKYPDFKYCNKWGNYAITDEQFESALNSYKSMINSKVTSGDDNYFLFQYVLTTVKDNVVLLFVVIIIIIILFVYLIFRKKRKKFGGKYEV